MFAQYFFGISLFLTSLFLILLVLVQRGRGGGLAGALGGAGGQSAFGTKAGDVFTKITVGVAFVWVALCLASIGCLNDVGTKFDKSLGTDGEPSEPSLNVPPEVGGTGDEEGDATLDPPPAGELDGSVPDATDTQPAGDGTEDNSGQSEPGTDSSPGS